MDLRELDEPSSRGSATLDALPPELVRRIVEHAVPDAFHSSTFPQRQQTLASLSRVCSRFRAIALDRLCEIVHIRSSDVKTLERTCKLFASRKSRSLVKEVVVNDNWADTLSLPVFITFIQDCANLETLAINRWSADVIVFPAKGVFQYLVELRIGGSLELRPSRAFPFLRSLSMPYDSASSAPLVGNFFPSLRNLAIGSCKPGNCWEPTSRTMAMSLKALLPHLDALSVPVHLSRESWIEEVKSKILFDLEWPEMDCQADSRATMEHLRLAIAGPRRDEAIVRIVGDSTNLRTVFYFSKFPRDGPDADLPAGLRDLCRRRGIELVPEPQPRQKGDPIMSEEFVRRRRTMSVLEEEPQNKSRSPP